MSGYPSSDGELPAKPGYFSRHRHGLLPLWKSYWINSTILGFVFLGIPGGLLASYLEHVDENPAPAAVLGVVTFFLYYVVVIVWMWVGTWRSATRYTRQYGTGWGTIAKATIAFGVVSIVAQLLLTIFQVVR